MWDAENQPLERLTILDLPRVRRLANATNLAYAGVIPQRRLACRFRPVELQVYDNDGWREPRTRCSDPFAQESFREIA